MKLYRFDSDVGKNVTHFNSKNSTFVPLSRNKPVSVGTMYLGEDSVLGMHPAASNQLFLVVSGEGWVKTPGNEKIHIQKGTAAFWEVGEEHESGSDAGMTVMILEGPNLDPSFLTTYAHTRRR
ncbi:cupin domain-containing protein [Alkalicoccobacillus murimartini]|uniref:Quercetin dioxygenase-like cupin family protein n=1 Tax=Alkalicoccobacillus murimartini TaxID=171685 RepID=A0ABT9YKL3_9BACI|nr:cupin [Alkalicoccobacillus murimartini]MDQ0208400.1 quercetin dioxygenase-like cupin family protein [Alkalicoccobacillus murimartini]